MQLRTQALQLLHHFLSLPAAQLQKLTQQIEELANYIFPASSWEWKRGSTQSVDYARQLMAIMDAMVTAAERGLSVEPILQVGHHHNTQMPLQHASMLFSLKPQPTHVPHAKIAYIDAWPCNLLDLSLFCFGFCLDVLSACYCPSAHLQCQCQILQTCLLPATPFARSCYKPNQACVQHCYCIATGALHGAASLHDVDTFVKVWCVLCRPFCL